MKYKILLIINVLCLLFSAGIIIYEIALADEINKKLLAKAAVIFVTFSLALLKIRPKRSVFDKKLYADRYKEIIGDAFQNDRKSLDQLISAIVDYNYDKYDKAIKRLDKLAETSCTAPCDYSAVLTIKALCLESQQLNNAAIETYEELLRYDNSNSNIWSNLGHLYSQKGESVKCENAYLNAIHYNPENLLALNNLAALYFSRGDAERTLEYALRTLELKPDMYQAMSAASLAYKMMGDYENSENYFRLYCMNGGDSDALKKALENVGV